MALREPAKQETLAPSTEFLHRIGRGDLEQVITPEHPLMYVSPEFGLNEIGALKGRLGYAGGLGILSGDHVLQLAQTGLNADAVGLLHTRRMKPVLNSSNWQEDEPTPILSPEELGLDKQKLQVAIKANGLVIPLDVYDLKVGGETTLHLLYEKGLGEVYPGDQTSDHRLYQMSALGFGGWQVMEQTNKIPAKLHLNESSTALTAVAMWDRALQQLLDQNVDPGEAFTQSLKYVRDHTILTNHTLVPAAEASYQKYQYEHYVMDNIQSPAIRKALNDLIDFNGGSMRILDLGMFMSGQFNGVSILHADLATQLFQKQFGEHLDDGRPMEFKAVTNAIDNRWYERVHELYRKKGILDEFDLPTADYAAKVDALTPEELKAVKDQDRAALRQFLQTATLANNEPRVEVKPAADGHPAEYKQAPLILPDNAVVIGWARRFADYKRPGMMVEDLDMIKGLIARHPNVHIVYSGKAHPSDSPMKVQMQTLLNKIRSDEVLSKHVHFVQDYDIDVGKALTGGADIWVNNPRVGREACGTSIFKAVANNALLVSTPDGGAADVDEKSYIAIKGKNEREEQIAMYYGLEEAIQRVEYDGSYWADKVKQQLKSFIPIIAGGRMIADYVNFQFPQTATS